MKPENQIQFFELIAKIFEIPLDQVTPELAVGSIPQWDSLGHLALISSLEENFAITFDVDELFEVETVSDFMRLLEKEGF